MAKLISSIMIACGLAVALLVMLHGEGSQTSQYGPAERAAQDDAWSAPDANALADARFEQSLRTYTDVTIGEICEAAREGGEQAVFNHFTSGEFPWVVDDPAAHAERFTAYCTGN